jgi:hypothetical protein
MANSRNADAQACESHFGLKGTLFPADNCCCRITEEDMENKVDEIALALS